ncbi:hypothetical protein H3S80_02305 [Bartonella sp. M0177]|uniref:hypothetical protein n=1 Tax=Bartonella sp. M0177 TaxID=2750940 RepID=UPI0018DEBF5B|nr:hypothetical protein [Bartonella sp. M0177]MBI0002881.1 hypothetical protein [Bartonella sp. M0177]
MTTNLKANSSDPASIEKRRIRSRFFVLLIAAVILVILLVFMTFIFFDMTGIDALDAIV